MGKRLEGKIALITGGSKGIGKAIAKLFMEEGANIIVTGRNENDLNKLVAEFDIPKQQKFISLKADVTSEVEMQQVLTKILEEFGRIDILCHNAGIYPATLLKNMTLSEWNNVIHNNLTGSFITTKLCLDQMSNQQYGKVVMISSITGPHVGQPGFAHYGASKAGINGFIKNVALEYAHQNITINGIEPGNIKTEGLDDRPLAVQQALIQAIPMKKLGDPEDVAYAALFLASDESKYITGTNIIVDGGQLLPEAATLTEYML